MAFDLEKLARAAEFSFPLRSVGIVRCKSLSDGLMSQALHRLKAPEAEGRELARWLLGEMAKRPSTENFEESDPIEGDSLTSEQLTAVTDQELESFSERLLQINRYLVRAHEGEELKRGEGQSACDFLALAIVHRCAEEKSQIDRIIQSATKPLFVESTLDSIKKSIAASNQLEDLIKQYSGSSALDSIKESIAVANKIEDLGKQYAGNALWAERVLSQVPPEPQVLDMPLTHFPKNPILETNQILEELATQIEGMRPLVAQGAELIRSMNDTALRMQADYITNAARSDRHTKVAMRVAVWSLIVSAIGLVASSYFSYQSYADAKASAEKGNSQIQAFEKGIKDLTKAQREDSDALFQALADAKRATPSSKK